MALSTRFPGDPGLGNFYFGGREDQLTWPSSATAIANWESNMAPWSGGAPLGIIRQYSNGSITTGWSGRATTDTHIAANRLVHVSFKLASGVTQSDCVDQTVAFTGWMDALADAFNAYAPVPIWWTFHHEPENDANWQGSGEAEYRTVCRNIKNALVSRGVTNGMFWTTGYMCPYTFGDAGGARDWRAWYPDWKGTTQAGSSKNNPDPVDFYLPGDPNAVVDGIGLDVYSWWNEGESMTSWDDFETLFDWAASRMDFLGLPYNIMEHGVQAYHTGTEGVDAVYVPATTLDYISGMYDTMTARNIVAMQVFNYAIVDQAWRLEIQDPQQIRYEGYGTGMARSECKLPASLGWL
ncbi:hypothetical protein JNM87_02275 [Candidatus Saccharibacteria bacterium]|nr:hypothetical protein [Candidatus Saccharibacteria bacterium]